MLKNYLKNKVESWSNVSKEENKHILGFSYR